MKDNAAREHVAAALGGVQGVVDVDVNLMRALATVIFRLPCTADALCRVVREACPGAAARVRGGGM